MPPARGPTDAVISERLQAGQLALRQIRRRISGLSLLLALASVAFVVFAPTNKCRERQLQWKNELEMMLYMFAAHATFVMGALSALADDKAVTMCVLVLSMLAYLPACVRAWHFAQGLACHFWCLVWSSMRIMALAFYLLPAAVALCLGLRGLHASRVQNILWRGATANLVANGLASCLSLGVNLHLGMRSHFGFDRFMCSYLLIPFVLVPVTSSQRLRDRIHVWLLRCLAVRTNLHAAAGIAGLLGSSTVKEALAQARKRFRSVDAGGLAFEALLSNTAQAHLNVAARPLALGTCDAFLSHSWHDQPEAKWRALRGWHEAFLKQMGREARVWFDKYCIDQSNIEADLRSLPIFLSGCRSLVVLLGPTYLQRLWCIMELFTYVHMGGALDRVSVVHVLREGREEEDRRQIRREAEAFTAEDCRCSKQEDKDQMLSIIRAAFGSVDEFDVLVRDILDRTGLSPKSIFQAEWHSGGSDSSESGDTDSEEREEAGCLPGILSRRS